MSRLSYILVEQPDSFDSFDEFAKALRRIKELGYQGVELNMVRPAGFETDELADLSKSLDLPVASFMTGANYFGEGLCLSSPDAQLRQRTVERLQEYTTVASRLHAIMVIGQMQGFHIDEPDRELAEARIEECLRDVVEVAEQNGTTVVLEPVNHLQTSFHNTLSQVTALVERIGSPRLKPMLDTFHMNIEEQSIYEPIKRVGANLGHFHLCETNGGAPGSGHLNFKAVFTTLDTIGYSGWVSIKNYRQPWHVGAEAYMQHLMKEMLLTQVEGVAFLC